MKKKIILVVLSFVMALTMVTGCTTKNDQPGSTTGATSANANTSTIKAIAKDKLKIGVVYIGPATDGGYTTTHDTGIKKMATNVGLKENQVVFKESIPEDATCKDTIENLIDDGCNIIIGTSFGYGQYMDALAKENPTVIFMHCSGSFKNAINFSNYFGHIEQAMFLTGIAAGMKTVTNKIGYVVAQSYPECIRNVNAFTLGVQSVKPEAVVKVIFTNTWYDPTKEKQTAETLLADGCDVLAQHQDTAATQIAANDAKVWSIGYNMDMSAVAVDANLTSAVWDWSVYYTAKINDIIAGTWKANESYWTGLETGVVGIAPLTKNAAVGTQAKIDEYKAKIIDGTFNVFGNREILDQDGNVKVKADTKLTDADLLAMTWFVKGIEGTIPKS